MTSKSKNKGNSWEREIAIFLSELYADHFVRVANSGAYIGGLNTHRKQKLSENQVKSFKGDITPPDSWCHFNAEAKNYADFPFHLALSGECKQLETWIEQLMAVADPDDLSILFIKVTRKGRFVCVQSNLTWKSDQFLYYTSKNYGDWILIDFDHFFKNNKDLLKFYSTGPLDTTSITNIKTQSITPIITSSP